MLSLKHFVLVIISIVLVSGQNDGFVLRMFDEGTEALCLDGTRAGYYIRPGNASNSVFIVELEGGGWCDSEADCYGRSFTDIGSSKNWPPTGCPGMDGGSNGLLSSDCTINPYFCNATKVHLNYCDGASFAGYRANPITYNNTPLYFRGRSILDESINYLVNREGMNQAKSIILKGCSAGGLATILHLDYFTEQVQQLIPGVSVVGVPDAGTFLDHNNTQNQPSWTPLYQYVANMQNTTPSVNNDCVNYYSTDEQWKCFMAQYTIPFLKTPAFFAQDLSDSWQLTNIYELGCNPSAGQPGNCNTQQMNYLYQYAIDTRAVLNPLFTSTLHGGFFTNCVQHCHSNINFCYNGAMVQNQTMEETFMAWYNLKVHQITPPANIKTTVVDEGVYGTNPTCTTSCSPY